MRHFQYWIIFGALTFVMGACSSKTGEVETGAASTSGFSLVQDIALNETDGGAKIVVSANKEPKYNVFKLTDPERIMIDLIDAELNTDNPESLLGDGGMVESVKIQGIQDSISTLVRLEVRLNEAANYLASIDGTSLVVRVFPAGAEMPEDEMGSDEPVIGALPPLPVEGDDFASDLPPLGDEPSLEDPDMSTALESSDMPSFESSSDEAMDVPALPDAPMLSDVAPLPSASPLPEEAPVLEDGQTALSEMPEISEAPEAMIEDVPSASTDLLSGAEETPPAVAAEPEVVAPVPVPVPVPLVDEKEEQVAQATESEEENRVIVEPEGPPLPEIETQDIPTSELTEGTSLLSGIGAKVYTGKRVSLEFQEADVQDVLRLIAEVSKLNIILSDEVKGQITLKLIDVPWDQALDIILTSKGLDKVQHGNILRVAPIESLKKEREIALANDKAAKQLEPLKLKLFNVNYATASEMSSRIKNLLSERGSVDTDERTNTLIVEDIAENLSRVENLINVLDTQTPQVRIESRIVQANDTFSKSLGIQWGPTLRLDDVNGKQTDWQFPRTINVGTAPQSGVGFTAPSPPALSNFAVDALPGGGVSSIGFRLGSINDIFNLDLRLQYAESQQLGRVVSRPSVTVLDNRTARIIQGTKIPFLSSSSDGSNVQFQEAGIEITVTPQITNDGAVILKVATKSNEPVSGDVGGNPIISIREANTEMLIKSGRTAVLGGVFKTTEREGKAGVPGLMHIPVLGWLFKGQDNSSEREETLIFITPYILTDTREAVSAPASTSQLEP